MRFQETIDYRPTAMVKRRFVVLSRHLATRHRRNVSQSASLPPAAPPGRLSDPPAPARATACRLITAALCVAVSAGPASAQSGGGYTITKSALSSGGSTTLAGSGYTIGCTVGQHDAAYLTGGDYTIFAGFWSPQATTGDPPRTPTWDCPGGDIGQNICTARTRALTFRMVPPAIATGGSGSSAIQIAMLELQNPDPSNNGCCPPPDFGTYESVTCTAAGEGNQCARWVGPPFTYLEAQELPGFGNYRASRLQCTPYYDDWENEPGQLVNVIGAEILPSSTYAVRAYGSDCKGSEGTCTNVSAEVTIKTRRAGDIAAGFAPLAAGQPNAIDVVGAVNNFKKAVGAPKHLEAQVQPNLPNLNRDVDALDIQAIVANVKLGAYPYSGPCPCPSTVVCNATPCSGTNPCAGGNLCLQTCSAGPRTGELCTSNKHCGMCVGGTRPGIPCDNSGQCDGGTCTTGTCNTQGFCRDKCGRCN